MRAVPALPAGVILVTSSHANEALQARHAPLAHPKVSPAHLARRCGAGIGGRRRAYDTT